jgi:cytoskeletal protein CcmA (bactofilin family)
MFRKKESEPARPVGLAESPAPPPAGPSVRPLDAPRPTLQPELPRRQIDIPAAPSAGPLSPGGPVVAGPGAANRAGDAAAAGDAAGKRLIVGPGISLSGEITACDRLVVQGSVQVTLNETRAIEIAESGRFTNGKAEVEEAEISGVYEGDLTVRNRLLIRSTGQVKGTVRYGELEIERGGRLSGSVSMLESGAK